MLTGQKWIWFSAYERIYIPANFGPESPPLLSSSGTFPFLLWRFLVKMSNCHLICDLHKYFNLYIPSLFYSTPVSKIISTDCECNDAYVTEEAVSSFIPTNFSPQQSYFFYLTFPVTFNLSCIEILQLLIISRHKVLLKLLPRSEQKQTMWVCKNCKRINIVRQKWL